jgi:hypothetical protein
VISQLESHICVAGALGLSGSGAAVLHCLGLGRSLPGLVRWQALFVWAACAAGAGCHQLPLAMSRHAGETVFPVAGITEQLLEPPQLAEINAGQLVIHADFPLARRHRIVRDLEQLRVDISERLSLPISDEPIHLYLFEHREEYEAYAAATFPGFPARRAFFVKTDTSLSIYAHWQDRIAEDLRHETTHGYVHAVGGEMPLWLDEGIAEYFEVPRSQRQIHRQHVDRLAARLLEGTWQPDLHRLESQVDAGLLTQDHYAEAWCWVHWLLETSAERRAVLQDYLTEKRRDPSAPPLSVRLARSEGGLAAASDDLVDHLLQLEELESVR